MRSTDRFVHIHLPSETLFAQSCMAELLAIRSLEVSICHILSLLRSGVDSITSSCR
jgi:hypothetical protein